MSLQKTPDEVWIDVRVAKTMPDQPKPEFDENQVRYFSADRVRELVQMAKGGPEFFIQITTDTTDGGITGLTNYGRIFFAQKPGEWIPVDVPNFEGGDHA